MTKATIRDKEFEINELTVEQMFELEDFFKEVSLDKSQNVMANIKNNYGAFKKALSHLYGENPEFFNNLPGSQLLALVSALTEENQVLIKNSLSILGKFGELMEMLGMKVVPVQPKASDSQNA